MKEMVFPIDITTGEIVPGIEMTDEEDRRRRKEYWERANAKVLRRKDHKPLGEFYMATCTENQFDGLQPQDIARLVYLASHMDYDCTLKDGYTPLKLSDLPRLLCVSKTTFDRLWAKIEERYIAQQNDGTLTVTNVFLRGQQNRVSSRLTKIFIQKLQELYQNAPKSKCRYLGYVFQLLYNVSVEYNLLVKNPYERDLSKVEPITLKEFASIIGYDELQISRLEKAYSSITFECDGEMQHFCAFVDKGRNTGRYVVVNPRIFYAGTCHEQVDVLGLFFK